MHHSTLVPNHCLDWATSLKCIAALTQELQSYLQTHRPWLQNLLADSLSSGLEGSATQTQQAALLSSLIAALLKCCDPEVCTWVSQRIVMSAAHSQCTCRALHPQVVVPFAQPQAAPSLQNQTS